MITSTSTVRWFDKRSIVRGFTGTFLALAALAVAQPARAADAPLAPLDQALLDHGRELIEALKKNYPKKEKPLHVAVLPFLVRKNDKTVSNAGPLNLLMTARLEATLILSLREGEDKHFGILPGAAATLAKEGISVRDYLSRSARDTLFGEKLFLPAWGEPKKVQADIFLTGLVQLSPNRRTLTVVVEGFDRNTAKGQLTRLVGPFQAAAELRPLVEAGGSFLRTKDLQNQIDADLKKQTESPPESLRDAAFVMLTDQGAAPHPLDPNSTSKPPIRLTIYYDKDPQTIRVAAGSAEVDEPRTETKVSLELCNTSKRSYGVLLLVNGKNTLYPDEPLPRDLSRSAMWVLKPESKILLEGFFQGDGKGKGKFLAFNVLPESASERKSRSLGTDLGTITLVAFAEKDKQKPEEKEATNRYPLSPEMVAIGSQGFGIPATAKRLLASSLVVAQNTLKSTGTDQPTKGTKGLIVPGTARRGEVALLMDFECESEPEMIATVRYYKPREVTIPEVRVTH
ncbi:MAG TPA: hypothetical protein VFA18_17290 [Gemmataceae bacterium]|nr:hypothetical protein [Gemmataceae bacterium]